MKNLLGLRSAALVSSWTILLFGCDTTSSSTDREAELNCETIERAPSPRDWHRSLPVRFEAESLPARTSNQAVVRAERDAEASMKRVATVRFDGAGPSLDFTFKSYDAADAQVWVRLRQGTAQGIVQAWVDDAKASAVTIDGHAERAVFAEVPIGAIAARPHHRHLTSHKVHLQVTGKNAASAGFGITVDFIELRAAPPPDQGPCAGQADGTACDDADACTQTDQCVGGKCVGGDPVVCGALDACHLAGACDPATGVCSNPAQPDGTACDDSSLCTAQDACVQGTCTGAPAVDCKASDACHADGVCDPATGVCSNPVQPDGTACNDGSLCTQADTCQAGSCVGGNPVTCPFAPRCQVQGACAPDTGVCSAASDCDTPCGNGQMDVGEECDDGGNVAGDGCSATCKVEFCGDGVVQPTIESLTFYYLGRACGMSGQVSFRINGVVVAQESMPETCDCQPGIRTLTVLDPALRGAAFNGVNNFELSSDGELAWAMAIVYTPTMGIGMPLWDFGGGNDVGNQNPDLCAASALSGFGMGMGVYLGGGESCDDGNNASGDGCSNSCQIE